MKDVSKLIIAIDFDGTCVTHDYPHIGKEIGASEVLKDLTDRGAKLILWTMRSNLQLTDAINWFKFHNIPLYGIQENPTQHLWTESPKTYAQMYIDDAALGAPLTLNAELSNRAFIDWAVIKEYFTSAESASFFNATITVFNKKAQL